jgi:hypothetical protein
VSILSPVGPQVLKLVHGKWQLFHDDKMLSKGALPILARLLQHFTISSQPTSS